jgi:hypothetical protein
MSPTVHVRPMTRANRMYKRKSRCVPLLEVKRVVDVVEKIMCALEEKKAMLRTITRARGSAKNTSSAYRWLNQQFFLPNPGRKSCITDPVGKFKKGLYHRNIKITTEM